MYFKNVIFFVFFIKKIHNSKKNIKIFFKICKNSNLYLTKLILCVVLCKIRRNYGRVFTDRIKNIDAIIFDIDETLYYSSMIRDDYVNYIFNKIKTLTKNSDWTYGNIKQKMIEVGFTNENKISPSFTFLCVILAF